MTDGYKIKRVLIWQNNEVRLPSTYQEVEYIESSGTQRIDTGIAPTDIKFGLLGKFRTTSGVGVLIDLSNTTSTDNKRYGFQFDLFKPQWSGIMYQGWGEDNGTLDASTDYEFSYNYNGNASFTINGITKTGIPTGSATMPNWNIFCQNCNGSYQRFFTGRLYRLQIYHNEDKLRDFVPCYRKSDSVIGLYDLVNNVFYTNDGSGTFTKGNDIPDMVEKQIYPAGWKPGANTIAYYPLTSTSTVNDMKGSGTAYNLTNNGYVSFGIYNGVDCAFFNRTTSQSGLNGLLRTTDSIIQSKCTISLWMKKGSNSLMLHYPRIIGTPSDNPLLALRRDSSVSQWQDGSIISSFNRDVVLADSSEVWRNVIILINNGSVSYYINNELKYTYSGSVTLNNGIILGAAQGRTQSGDTYYGYLSEVIIENKARTAQEIAEYYNQTKSNYGL